MDFHNQLKANPNLYACSNRCWLVISKPDGKWQGNVHVGVFPLYNHLIDNRRQSEPSAGFKCCPADKGKTMLEAEHCTGMEEDRIYLRNAMLGPY